MSDNSYFTIEAEAVPEWKMELADASAVVINAGEELSSAAGYTFTGVRFLKYFGDFAEQYGIRDMMSGLRHPFATREEKWAYWSRFIYVNRYMDPPNPVYQELYEIVKDKDYFVKTNDKHHGFQKAGFMRMKLFYTDGDYGLWQCSEPCHERTYDNYYEVRQMLVEQGFRIGEDGSLEVPGGDITSGKIRMTIPEDMVPHCPICDKQMTMNIRKNDTFVEDEGWRQAAKRYEDFLQRTKEKKTVFLEIGTNPDKQ